MRAEIGLVRLPPPQFLGGKRKITLEECMRQDDGPWRDPGVLKEIYAEGKGLRSKDLAFQFVPLPEVEN